MNARMCTRPSYYLLNYGITVVFDATESYALQWRVHYRAIPEKSNIEVGHKMGTSHDWQDSGA
jgi:hypothetical protein